MTPNMSYCMFENTANDLDQCKEALNEGIDIEELSSNYEKAGYKRVIELCCEIAVDYGHVVGIKLEEEVE